MPKIKTNKAAAKRFKRSGTGKWIRHKAFGRHLLTHKSAKTKRNLRKPAVLDPANQRRVRMLLPYS